jgi:hypothetical protein
VKLNLREKVVLKPCSLKKIMLLSVSTCNFDVTQNYIAVLGLVEVVYNTVYLMVSGQEILSLYRTTTGNYPEPDEPYLTHF